MGKSAPFFSYSTYVEKDTDLVIGAIHMKWERKEWEIPYYIVSDEVFALEESEFDNKPDVQDMLGMISFFYNESDLTLTSVLILKDIPEDLLKMSSFGEWLMEWQRYFLLSGISDVGYILSTNMDYSEELAEQLREHGFDEVLTSDKEAKAFYYYSSAYIQPVDYPDDVDGAVLQNMKDNGMDMSLPHEVEIILVAPNKRAAKKAAKIVKLQGYDVDIQDEDEGVALMCTTEMVLTHASIVKRLEELTELTEEFGVEIDGWGAMID
ncbi:LOW QUALITY PROTEIN: hypothetical protein JCM19046_1276 [Bacillus sp. JCM 19046]|nr:LOW QUALITY PROTEIN: hypothetical protein JCM19046_1276 [Bacillus sp. JCM 19046]